MNPNTITLREIENTNGFIVNVSVRASLGSLAIPTFAAAGYAFRNPNLLAMSRYFAQRALHEASNDESSRPAITPLLPQFYAHAASLSPAMRAKVEASSDRDLDQLKSELLTVIDRYNALTNAGKSLGAGQRADLAENENLLAAVRDEIAAREFRASGGGRARTVQDGPLNREPLSAAQEAAAARRGNVVAVTSRDDRRDWGFRNRAEYLIAVRDSSMQGGSIDPRLVANAPTTFGQEGVGADGGFAVPPDFRAEIIRKVLGEDALLSRTDQQTSSSNTFTVPADETTPWQSSGGIQAYWESEGGQKAQSKPDLKEKSVKLNKLIALVPVTDELLEDAPSLERYVSSKAPEKMVFRVNDAIINGTGAGMPKGILTSAGTVVVAPESGQAADTVRFENIVKLWTRLTPSARRNAVWMVNPDVESQLLTMQFPGVGTAVPAYMPPGGLSAAPYGTLLGRPILPTEAAPALGDKGDIIFGDLRSYLSITKVGGIRTDVSIHVWFDYDITAFRFVLRVGGQPWWDQAITSYQAGTATRGFFATLAART